MTAALKERAALLLERDRETRAQVPQANTSVYPSSSGVKGSELYEWFTAGMRNAGVAVNEQTVMSLAAVVSCVDLIGATIASLPLHTYERGADGSRRRIETDYKWLFNESPAPNWTASSAWRHYSQAVGLHGDEFWIIRHRRDNSVIGFEPQNPKCATVLKQSGGRLLYVFQHEDGREVLEQEYVLHFPGVGFNGTRSMTPLRYWLKNAAGINIAADDFAAAFFANGARPDFALKTTGTLEPDAAELLRNTWLQRHSGPSNAHLPAVLTGGLEVQQLTLNAEDAQLIATRNLQVSQICMIYGVPPHMIGHTEKATTWGSGIEQMSIGFVRYTLRKHLDAIQQEINRKLWPRNNRVYAEFSTDALLEGDSTAQAAYFAKALGGPGAQGWMMINEVRRLKNLPPVDGGDRLIFAGSDAPAPSQENPDDA